MSKHAFNGAAVPPARQRPAPRVATRLLPQHDPEIAQRVQGWLDSERLLVWIPIFSPENFPDLPPQILQVADRYRASIGWRIRRPEDLFDLPEGITGWLMPADAADTDIACGRWEGVIQILSVRDQHGRRQSLCGEPATQSPV